MTPAAPTLLCLLPARNCAEDLPGYFESVRQFADGVLALDDGSTDETRAVLEAEPMVQTILTNPRRDGYRGWDDAANRNRLLASAGEFEPRWLLFLDADERIPADDGIALRAFVRDAADPESAYLFRVYQMVDDLDHYDRAWPWVGRMFVHRPGLRIAGEGLHLVPLPTVVPRDRWRRTTIRIQHLSSLTDARRRARYEKYREADPGDEYHRDYESLLASPLRVRSWWPRPRELAVVANDPVPDRVPASLVPVISVVVIAQNDEDEIDDVMHAVFAQRCREPFEVIVVTSGSDRTAAIVRDRFPQATLIELDHPVFPGAARNAAVRVARSRFITCADSHVLLAPDALDVQLAAHRRGYALVTGAVENGTRTPAGWATYFLDNHSALPGTPSARLHSPPVRCGLPVAALADVGGFPEDMRAGEDTVVIGELFERGYSAWYDGATVMTHRSRCRSTGLLLAHHFTRGRAIGRILVDDALEQGRFPTPRIARFVCLRVPVRVRYVTRRVWAAGGTHRSRYLRVLPLVIAGAVSWWLGGCYEVARRARGARASLNQNRDRRRRSRYQPATPAARASASQGRHRSSRDRSPGA